ncbi:hypothetical protein [Spiroplasma phoeniceum]|uniref:Uncharacterized protein n=1 Tax=Spiroplasma phoeniceum P40 TaxID=1276259 RepID=A0A345DPP2_9MOLU|nr:hypothetical protein [Spiroplasma phoeniceum]AXF95064.1 hypothetical protein SDAV_0048 [Spiroplasma phoeniceum P40]AXF96180.1 hypothetical protein SDAV_001213 [Spiroplasma phoeniceum P40]AXF96225.1 hypothetical protein SDAV_001258 [Spiroplasma phoeniceum P40]
MISIKNIIIGGIIHIGKKFRSIDNFILENRYMCILGYYESEIAILPMSTYKDEKHKIEKKNKIENLDYSLKHGNVKDGYIKCDQIYLLSIEDFNEFEEVEFKFKMDSEFFEINLINKIKELKQKNKIKIKKINF